MSNHLTQYTKLTNRETSMHRLTSLLRAASLTVASLALIATADTAAAQQYYGEPEFKCVSAKQKLAGKFCASALKAWSGFDKKGDAGKRDAKINKAGTKLAGSWSKAEAKSSAAGVDCVAQTVTAGDMYATVNAAVAAIAAEVNTGLTLSDPSDADCGSKLLKSTASLCGGLLNVESKQTKAILKGGLGEKKSQSEQKVTTKFDSAWSSQATCSTAATSNSIQASVSALGTEVKFDTLVSPTLDDTEFQPVSFDGLTDTVDFDGEILTPRCGFDGNEDYHFFVKRGSVNKVVMYYQGGGACWDNLTCGVPVCKNGADPISDDPDLFTTGYGDLTNPDNPFKDWNIVFVTYCTCDIHYGDAVNTYEGQLAPVTVHHNGFTNAQVAAKYARDWFMAPDEVFVTGSSAGSYGALFNGARLPEIWALPKYNVLGDAGNGVITPDFLDNEFGNWNFQANLPDNIPGVLESIISGDGLPAYLEAVSLYYPDTKWANYSTAYDGGSGGQSGFYNIMLNGNDPIAALSWWDGACPFNAVMVQQAIDTEAAIAPVTDNYRYYVGTGSYHTMYGIDRVYDPVNGTLGGESMTVTAWINQMLDYEPGVSPSSAWENVSCSNCGYVFDIDPKPNNIPTPPFQAGGPTGVEIVCP